MTTDEVRTTSSTGAEKGVKEARYDLIPIPPLEALAKLYGRGAEKYAAHNWRKGYEWSKSYAAAMRHMTLFWNGEDIDEEMQTPHVICAAFHMFALATYLTEHPEMDDRFRSLVEGVEETIPDVHFDGVGNEIDKDESSLYRLLTDNNPCTELFFPRQNPSVTNSGVLNCDHQTNSDTSKTNVNGPYSVMFGTDGRTIHIANGRGQRINWIDGGPVEDNGS